MANFYDLPPEVVLKNTKTKIYADGSSTTTYCNNYIFVDKNLKEYQQNQKILQLKRKWEKFEKSQQEEDTQTDMFEIIKKPAKVSKEERGERTDILKRAKDKVFDIAFSNEWSYFLTITFNGSEYDFSNADFVKKKLRRWLENQVKRKDMKYLLIPERHKNGGIHCHALINDCFDVVDSGTRLVTGYNKPVTLKTIEEKNLHVRNVVYNIPEWKYGFSTAIPVENNSAALAFYITKYITKGNNKIFGKYYWSSRNCNRDPQIIYSNTDFNSVSKSAITKPYTSNQYKYNTNVNIIPNFEEVSSRFDNIADFLDYIYSDEYRKEYDDYFERSELNE